MMKGDPPMKSPKVKAIPAGHHNVTPYLIVDGAKRAIEFYKTTFGAKVAMDPIEAPGGRIGHAELTIGDSMIMLADEAPEMGAIAPTGEGGMAVSLHLYVENVDKVADLVLRHGGKERRPVQDMFYGDRSGTFADPFGHVWHIATHVEDVPHDELLRRVGEAMKQRGTA